MGQGRFVAFEPYAQPLNVPPDLSAGGSRLLPLDDVVQLQGHAGQTPRRAPIG